MKYILRFDDITPGMSWSKFKSIESVLIDKNIKPVMGVVPSNLDNKLCVENENNQFWDVVRTWRSRGYSIAQHGFNHIYHTNDSGILKVNNNSEFSGLPFENQFKKLKDGKAILVEQGVWQPIFMAPSHSFDANTIRALRELDFEFITDGYGVYPYEIDGLTLMPQLFSSGKNFGFGVYTICIHLNNMTDKQVYELSEFIKNNCNKFILFDDACGIKPIFSSIAMVSRLITSSVIPFLRNLRRHSLQ